MPGSRPHNFRPGDRSEYLGAFLLSRISQSVPVPRQEDFGVDHLGALLHVDGQSIRIGRRFGVQWKSNPDDLARPFGAHRKGKWRPFEVRWLLGRHPFPVDTTPFFLAHVDLERGTTRLYSTALMWHARWLGYPAEVAFLPDTWPEYDGTFPPGPIIKRRPLAEVYPDGVPDDPPGLKERIEVPLGYPIAELSLDMVAKPDPCPKLDAVVGALDTWARLEERNRLAASLEIPVCFWFPGWLTNEAPAEQTLQINTYAHPDPKAGLPASDVEQSLWPFVWAFHNVVEQQRGASDSDPDLVDAMGRVMAVMQRRRCQRKVTSGFDPVGDTLAFLELRRRCEELFE